MAESPHILIIEARSYEDMADELLRGAEAALTAADATFDVVSVPSVLEIPAALVFALQSEENEEAEAYDGFVALGTVLRPEAALYDIASGESTRALVELSTEFGLAIGNGIHAVVSAAAAKGSTKGTEAAEVALAMVALKRQFGL